jgi:hypothetical protein
MMMAGARSPAFLLFFLASYGMAWVTIQRSDNIVGLRSTFDAGDADALPQGNITISVSYRQYLPFRSMVRHGFDEAREEVGARVDRLLPEQRVLLLLRFRRSSLCFASLSHRIRGQLDGFAHLDAALRKANIDIVHSGGSSPVPSYLFASI